MDAMGKLNTFVHAVELDDNGVATSRAAMFGPGDELPDWAVRSITNPDVWDGDPPRGDKPRERGNLDTAADRARKAEQRADVAEAELAKLRDQIAGNARLDEDVPQEPPRGGAGSGADAWRTFLAGQGIEDLPEHASREDLVALWDARKIQG